MDANKSEKAIQHAAKAIGKTFAVVSNFDKVTKISTSSQRHSSPDLTKDRDAIIKELSSNNTFKVIPGRKHRTFAKMCNSILTRGRE